MTNQEGAAKNEVGWDDLSLRVVQGLSPPENFAAQLWIPAASDVHQLVAAVLFAQRSDETSWRWTACQLKHRADGWQLVARESMESTSPWTALTDRPSINEWGASAGHVRFEQTTAKFVDGKWLFMRHIRATREVHMIEFEGRRRSVPEHGHLVLTWESAKPPVSPGKGWEPNSYTRAFAADGTELIVLRVGW